MYIIVIESVCFFTALICLLKDASSAWRSMVLFLWITCITETAGLLIRAGHHHNQWVYNIFLIFEAGFTSLMFNSILGKYINSKPLILGGLAIISSLYIYEIIDHGIFVFNDYTTTVMSVFFVFYSFLYYFKLIEDEESIELKRDASFWWVAGALFFYFGSTACNLFYPRLKNVVIEGHNITYYIFLVLTLIMYGCWIYSFICKKWLTTTLQS
jgi:hypothetical protein